MGRRKQSEILAFIAELQKARDEHPLLDEAALAAEEAPLVAALNEAGLKVASVWDLVNTKETYSPAVPILLTHLQKPYHRRIREGIARSLAVPGARIGWQQLVEEYERIEELDPGREVNELKWSLHLAIGAAADPSVLDELIRLTCDRRHGEHRSFFVDALARMRDARASAALAELRSDPDLREAFERVEKRARRRKRPHV
jgi:hypothetical protein